MGEEDKDTICKGGFLKYLFTLFPGKDDGAVGVGADVVRAVPGISPRPAAARLRWYKGFIAVEGYFCPQNRFRKNFSEELDKALPYQEFLLLFAFG